MSVFMLDGHSLLLLKVKGTLLPFWPIVYTIQNTVSET